MRTKKPERRLFKVKTHYRDYLADEWYPNKLEVLVRGDTRAVRCTDYLRPDYYHLVTFDGTSNMVFEYKHGGGEGRIVIPAGGIYSILEAFEVMHKMGVETLCKNDIVSVTEEDICK